MDFGNHHLRHGNHLRLLKEQLNEIYLMHAIDGFALSLIGIFVPIYLLILGFSVSQVIIFFIVQSLTVPFASFLVGFISSRYGLKHTMLLRFPFMLVFLLMLYSLDSFAIPILLIAVIGGFQTTIYWIPLHSLFARSANKKSMSSDVGKLYSFPRIASMIAPLIGGIITLMAGFNTLFIVAMILLVVSIIPLFFSKEIKPHVEFRFSEGIKLFKKYPKVFFGVAINHLNGITEAVIWPMVVYFLLASTLSVGIMGTLLGVGTVFFTLLVGKLSDKFKRLTIIKIGAILMLLMWIARFFVQSDTTVYLVTIMAGFFMFLVLIPFTAINYAIARENNIDEFIIFREIPVAIGRVLVLLLALFFASNIKIAFFLASIAHIFYLFF
ncbi:MFS transporter [Candidatus Woesearchaeota archaeon]|nr:MFS transporter [Candidatus Woesearchaeota archaeon]